MSTASMRNGLSAFFFCLFVVSSFVVSAEEPKIVDHNQLMDHGDGHLMDMEGGMVMGQNKDKLPPGCDRVSEDVKIEVHAGRKYSKPYPGTIFGFEKHEWHFKPCTRLTVTFVNEDSVRHQWMMHGLPKMLYDKGMFHLEITGPAKITGTLILPAEDKTYLVHCDIAQHMEKGMKGQLIVGKGSGTFPSIPGVTDPALPDDYGAGGGTTQPVAVGAATTPAPSPSASSAQPAEQPSGFFSGYLIVGLLIGFVGAPYLIRAIGERCKGMTAKDVLTCGWRLLRDLVNAVAKFLVWLYQQVSGKGKMLPKQ